MFLGIDVHTLVSILEVVVLIAQAVIAYLQRQQGATLREMQYKQEQLGDHLGNIEARITAWIDRN